MMAAQHESYPDTHSDPYSKTIFGFWIYLLTDFLLFSTLFAAYAVLRKSTFGGPTPKELFNLEFVTVESFVLLCSSFTAGLGGAYTHRRNKTGAILFFILTFVMGLIFLGLEWQDLGRLIHAGYTWKTNAFLSAYYTLVGTHALHVIAALLWSVIVIIPVFRRGITAESLRRLTCLRMFWQFLNVVWVFIFSIVYFLGEV